MVDLIRQFTLVILVPLPLLIFWAWMFRDMLNNRYLPANARTIWTWEFVFLSLIAAVHYYATEYRPRR